MDAATRKLVRSRAGDRCEYCLIPQEAVTLIPFHVEHIIAKQHQRDDRPDNLAFACDRCNAFKGPNLSSINPETGELVSLFHPRRDVWTDHFLLSVGKIVGLTPTGKATARLLMMNYPRRVELRLDWIDETGGL
jgi:5-methylcytosine-specific restriction endonuclease McrA